jgi:hypothetical protein
MSSYATIRAAQQAYWASTISKAAVDIAPHFDVVSPTVNSDYGSGFRKGQLWLNTVSNVTYICEDPAEGAAIWNTT